jgi:hypothetical protein
MVLLDGDGELTNRREPSGNVTSSGSTPPQNSPLTTGGTRLDFSVEVASFIHDRRHAEATIPTKIYAYEDGPARPRR